MVTNKRSTIIIGILLLIVCTALLTRASQLGSFASSMMLATDSNGNPVCSNVSVAQANAAIQGRSFSSPTRSLNSAFQISNSRDSLASYSVDIAATISLTTGQTGTVYLKYADDSGFTTNVIEVCRFINGNSGSLTIGLNLTQTNTAMISGMIPAGKYAQIVTQNNTGTPSFTYRSGQEVLM